MHDSEANQALVFQQTRVFKAGNSLALRIPSGIAKQLDLEGGTSLEMTVNNGAIWIRPGKPRPTLQELVDKITSENLHAEQFPETTGNEFC